MRQYIFAIMISVFFLNTLSAQLDSKDSLQAIIRMKLEIDLDGGYAYLDPDKLCSYAQNNDSTQVTFLKSKGFPKDILFISLEQMYLEKSCKHIGAFSLRSWRFFKLQGFYTNEVEVFFDELFIGLKKRERKRKIKERNWRYFIEGIDLDCFFKSKKKKNCDYPCEYIDSIHLD